MNLEINATNRNKNLGWTKLSKVIEPFFLSGSPFRDISTMRYSKLTDRKCLSGPYDVVSMFFGIGLERSSPQIIVII